MNPQSTVLITGGANGIGRAIATVLARRGTPLGLIDRNSDALREFAESLKSQGAKVAYAAVDVMDRDGLIRAVEDIAGTIGPIDVLVASAGIGSLTMVPQLETAMLRQTLDVNVVGVAHAMEAVLPGMILRGKGHIVGLASMAGFRGLPWMISYCASKAALISYLEACRPGLRKRGITVTTVCPSFIRTQMTLDIPSAYPIKMVEPEAAARHLVRAIDRRARNCHFPLQARISNTILRMMPDWCFDRLMSWVGPRAMNVEF